MFDFDGVLKDLFQRDRPDILNRLTGGVKIKAFLNVELHRVRERRVDLVILLENGTLLHIELQSANDRRMRYRMVSYWGLLKEQQGRPVRQAVLYVGGPALNMQNRLDEDGNTFSFETIDIRSFEAAPLIASKNPADLALAILAGGGSDLLPEILKGAAKLKGEARARVLAQILVLAGLRGVSIQVESKLEEMGMVIDATKNPVLMRMRQEAISEGRSEGRSEGQSALLIGMMGAKFGPLPKWATERITKARSVQLERWSRKLLVADSLELVLGKRQSRLS